MVSVHVDDGLAASAPDMRATMTELQKLPRFGSSGMKFCGRMLRRPSPERIEVSLSDIYVVDVPRDRPLASPLPPGEQAELRRVNGCRGYAVKSGRRDTAYGVSEA